MDVSDIVMLFYCPSSIVYVYLPFASLIMYLGTTTHTLKNFMTNDKW